MRLPRILGGPQLEGQSFRRTPRPIGRNTAPPPGDWTETADRTGNEKRWFYEKWNKQKENGSIRTLRVTMKT